MIGQRGVGLIEVLISLVVIAIGLLGLAALQGKAQKAELESYQRSQALILVQDLYGQVHAKRIQECPTDVKERVKDELISGDCTVKLEGNEYVITVNWKGLAGDDHRISTPALFIAP